MAKAPAFQWYPKDCDTDENVRAMDDAEFGFYVRCLNHAWVNGGLPTDMVEFARIMHKTPKQLEKLWVRVSRCFFENSEKKFVNFRQEQQRQEQENFRKKRADAANSMHANKSRMHMHTKTEDESMHMQCSASASASATAKQEENLCEMPPPDPVQLELEATALRIHDRHPEVRRCPLTVVRKHLQLILKSHAKRHGMEKIALLAFIDKNHADRCAMDDWLKEGGTYAKSLEQWLAPTLDRYMQTISAKARDSPSGTSQRFNFEQSVEKVMRERIAEGRRPL